MSEATFVFADIAGFTALTEAHGDEEAANLVADFCRAVKAELPDSRRHAREDDRRRDPAPGPASPEQAVLLGLHIINDLMRGHGAPAIRVGLHHGPAVERDGDYFGATVNLAARVSAVATAGEVLVTGHTAALAPSLAGRSLRAARPPGAAERPRAGGPVRRRRATASRLRGPCRSTPSATWPWTPSTRRGD